MIFYTKKIRQYLVFIDYKIWFFDKSINFTLRTNLTIYKPILKSKQYLHFYFINYF